MTPLKLFLQDMWRTMVFFLLGYALMVATVALTLRSVDARESAGNLAYAFSLGFVALVLYLVVEYALRRRFYIGAISRLDPSSPLSTADTFSVGGTAEQRLFLRLLHQYHAAYVRDLETLSEHNKFYELFTTRFAHQMKTPMTVIHLLEQEMRTTHGTSPEITRFLDNLAEERIRIETTLGIMLSAVRLNSFSFDTRIEDIHVEELVRAVVNDHKREWVRRAIYPAIVSKQQNITVKSDRKWLQFAIDQIVRNALQYGQPAPSVVDANLTSTTFHIELRVDANQTILSFEDHGIGIPKRDLPHVFEPFYTGSNGRSHSRATGMGLYLVKEVLVRLGHAIDIASTEGQGTTVTITLSGSDYLSVADDLRM